LVVEQKVKELQERVSHLMIVILHRVTPENEDGSEEAVVTTMKGIEEDIKALVRYEL
jgi:2-iminoacetate synthase ThiH